MEHTPGPLRDKAGSHYDGTGLWEYIGAGPRVFFLTSPMVETVVATDAKWRRPMHVAKLHYVLDSIIRQRLGVSRSGRARYSHLHSKVLEKFCTWRFAKDAVQFLIDAGIIESDYEYLPGMKATGYRLTTAGWEAGFSLAPIPCDRREKYNRIHRDLRKEKAERLKAEGVDLEFLTSHLNRLEIPERWAASHLSELHEKAMNSKRWQDGERYHSRAYSISTVMKREWTFTRCRAGRLHYPITNLSKAVRRELRYQGKRLVEADVSCCQPLIAATLYWNDREHRDERERYLSMIQSGRFYEDLGELAGYQDGDRSKLKQDILKWVFFGGRTTVYRGELEIEHPLWQAFIKLFPILGRVLMFSKAEIRHSNPWKGDSELAIRLQGREANVFIDRVLAKVAKYYPEIPAFPVHDCMMTTAENGDLLTEVITEEFFKEVGVKPRVDLKGVA